MSDLAPGARSFAVLRMTGREVGEERRAGQATAATKEDGDGRRTSPSKRAGSVARFPRVGMLGATGVGEGRRAGASHGPYGEDGGEQPLRHLPRGGSANDTSPYTGEVDGPPRSPWPGPTTEDESGRGTAARAEI